MNFEEDVLPLLIEMSKDESEDGFRVFQFLKNQGMSGPKINRWVGMLLDDGYITADYQKNGMGHYAIFANAQITPKGLRQLNLWPSDEERALFLVGKIADTLDAMSSAEEQPAEKTKLKAAAGVLRDSAISIGAGILTSQL